MDKLKVYYKDASKSHFVALEEGMNEEWPYSSTINYRTDKNGILEIIVFG